MKKSFVALCAVLFAFNANAFDVAGTLNQVSATADSAAQQVEAAKTADDTAKANASAAVEAKKAEVAAKVAEQKAADEAKAAEQKKAVDDAQNSLNNLKNAFSK